MDLVHPNPQPKRVVSSRFKVLPAQTCMSHLRRCLLAAASARGLPSHRFVTSCSISPPPHRPSGAFPAAATTPLRPCHARAFSSAPGSGQPPRQEGAGAAGEEGSSGEAGDDATVKTVKSGRWKWMGLVALGVGSTIALSYDDLSKGDWQAGSAACNAAHAPPPAA